MMGWKQLSKVKRKKATLKSGNTIRAMWLLKRLDGYVYVGHRKKREIK